MSKHFTKTEAIAEAKSLFGAGWNWPGDTYAQD